MRKNKDILLTLLIIFTLSACASYRTFKKAESLMMEGKYDEAITYYNKALAERPGEVEYSIKLARAKDAAAQQHFQKGKKLFDENNLDEAEKELNLTLVLDPTFKRAAQALQEIKIKKEALESLARARTFIAGNKIKDAIEEAKKAYSLNPQLEEAKKIIDELSKAGAKSPLEYELSIKSSKPITLRFKDANLKEVFEVLSKLSGINFVFDDTVKDTKVTFFIEDASFVQALELLLFTNKLAIKVINPKNVIVYPDTKQKRKEYEEYYIRTFFLKFGDAKKIINTLRNLVEARQIFVNEDLNAIVLRADADSIALAEKIIEANDIPKPEVVMDLEFIEVNRNDLQRLGLDFSPNQMQFGFGKGSKPTTVVSSGFEGTPDLVNIRDLEVAKLNRNILFTLPTITLNFLKQNGVTKSLANPSLRALDGAKAQVHVGDRVPVITVTVSGADQRSENVQYVDVGVKFNAEPKIISNDEVELKIEAEVSNIISKETTQGGKGSTVYRIGTRNAKTVLRLKDGESTVLGGLIQNRIEKTKKGVAFLSDIPIIGSLFTYYADSTDQSDIFISITPRISKGVVYPSKEASNIWSGTEERLSSKPVFQSFTEGQPQPQVEMPKETSGITDKPEGEFKAEDAFVATIAAESIKVGEATAVEIVMNGLPPVVEFELSGSVNIAFAEPIKFTEAAVGGADDIYKVNFDTKSGAFSIYGKLNKEISGSLSLGRVEIKGKNKVAGTEIINLGQCKIKTVEGKVYYLKSFNVFMEVK